MRDHLKNKLTESALVLALVIFSLAIVPRISNLDTFVGPDEFFWATCSANFSNALATGDLAQTYQAGHPGVTLMWITAINDRLRYGYEMLLGSANWQAIVSPQKTMTMLASKRQAVAVAQTVLLVVMVLLLKRVLGNNVAWLAGFLLAFDPFPLSEFRALRTEGLVTMLNTLTLLSLLLYIQRPRLRYAILAGGLTGVGLLSKVSAAPLLPLSILVILGLEAKNFRLAPSFKPLKPLASYLIAVLLTILIFWPALWVAPRYVYQEMYNYVAVRALEGESGGDSFFWGQPTPNTELGLSFYPVVLLYRTSPILWLGLILLIIVRSKKYVGQIGNLSYDKSLLLYLILFFILIATARLKYDRYAMPLFPALDILAAMGLVMAWAWLTERLPRLKSLGWLAALLVLMGQMALAWSQHPYYYTYWNPLLGGATQAIKVLPVGTGGEGIEQIATYMNTLPNAKHLKLASGNSQKVAPLFHGKTIAMTNLDGHWFLGDYTFIHISQLQRGKHDPEIITYLHQKPLDNLVSLVGLEYAWLYRGPSAQYFGGDTKLTGRATLHAYNLSGTTLNAGQILTVTVYFRNDGQQPTDRFYVRLVDSDNYIWTEAEVVPRVGFAEAFRTRKAVVEGEAILPLPIGMPIGNYSLKMGYDEAKTGKFIGEFTLPKESPPLTIELPAVFPSPETLWPADKGQKVQFNLQNELNLLGYYLKPEQWQTGEIMWLTLYWQALTQVRHDYVLAVQLLDRSGQETAYWLGRPVRSGYPTNQWQKNQLVQDPWRLSSAPDVLPGHYTLALAVYDADTKELVKRISLQEVEVIK